jgi:aspartyl-tRNA synthetase
MFFPGEKPGSFETAHHPFTQPHPDDLSILQKDPLQVSQLIHGNVLSLCSVTHISKTSLLKGTVSL